MDRSLNKRAFIPPYWVNIAFGLAVLSVVVARALSEMEPGEAFSWPDGRMQRFLRLGGIYVVVTSCFHWSIHRNYIMVHFLWIPVRIIRWQDVLSAEYIYSWRTGSSFGKMTGQGIFVTLSGCPYFSPETDALNLFMMKHPFHTLFIRFTPRNQQRYVKIFQEYCPDLEFQIGYEENLKKGKPYIEKGTHEGG